MYILFYGNVGHGLNIWCKNERWVDFGMNHGLGEVWNRSQVVFVVYVILDRKCKLYWTWMSVLVMIEMKLRNLESIWNCNEYIGIESVE